MRLSLLSSPLDFPPLLVSRLVTTAAAAPAISAAAGQPQPAILQARCRHQHSPPLDMNADIEMVFTRYILGRWNLVFRHFEINNGLRTCYFSIQKPGHCCYYRLRGQIMLISSHILASTLRPLYTNTDYKISGWTLVSTAKSHLFLFIIVYEAIPQTLSGRFKTRDTILVKGVTDLTGGKENESAVRT